ncbi:MAG: hypothetical protein ABTD50_08290 [Polyangiaceae bacterium]|jgi:hypothetical protein
MIGTSRVCRYPAGSAALLLALSIVAFGAGCRHAPAQTDAHEHGPPPAQAAAVPIDHLAPGELLEGPEQAFGIALPRGIGVDGAFSRVVHASGRGSVSALTKYFEARVSGGEFRDGPESATFEHVRSPTRPDRDLRIHIRAWGSGVTVEVRDVTPPPTPDLPNEAARWRQVGLTPDGKLADPTHLE